MDSFMAPHAACKAWFLPSTHSRGPETAGSQRPIHNVPCPLIRLPSRCVVSQDETPRQQYGNVTQTCQWCRPIQREEVRGAGRSGRQERDGDPRGYTFRNPYICSPAPGSPHPLQKPTGLSEDPGMEPGQKGWAVKLRFNHD